MVSVGIGVSKDKRDYFILNTEDVAPADVFSIPYTLDGSNTLLNRIRSCTISMTA